MRKISIPWLGLMIVLAIGLTLLSQRFVHPVDCRSLCNVPENVPCPSGTCRAYEQRAGLPIPYRIDDPGGGSPTSGWGILGPEDLPNPLSFLVDAFFYFLVLWLAGYAIQVLRGQAAMDWLAILLPLVIILILLAAGYVLYRPVLGR
jgi:hypothetical protein